MPGQGTRGIVEPKWVEEQWLQLLFWWWQDVREQFYPITFVSCVVKNIRITLYYDMKHIFLHIRKMRPIL